MLQCVSCSEANDKFKACRAVIASRNAQGRVTRVSDPPLEGIGAAGVEAGISGLAGGVSRHPAKMPRRVVGKIIRYKRSNSHN